MKFHIEPALGLSTLPLSNCNEPQCFMAKWELLMPNVLCMFYPHCIAGLVLFSTLKIRVFG